MSTTVTVAETTTRLVPTTSSRLQMAHRPFTRPYVNLYPKPEDSGYIRSLPELVDFNADKNADHVFCIQARKDKTGDPLSTVKVTNAQLKVAVSRCAVWLKENVKQLQLPSVGEDGNLVKGRPIALLMESDVGLVIHQFALMSVGVPILLLSARLSPAAIHHLVNRADAVAILASKRLQANASEALALSEDAEPGVPLYTPVSYGQFIPAGRQADAHSICSPYHYIGPQDRNVLILHSSGTTGLPKPIYVSHQHLVCFTTCHDLNGEIEAQGVNVSTLPLFHGFGLMAPALAMGVGKTFCLPPTSVVSSATSTIDLIVKTNAASLMSVPSILEDIALTPNGRGTKVLAKLDFVTFGGGILKSCVGERLASDGVRILNHYGTTECGPLTPIFRPQSDYNWRFFRLRKDVKMNLDEITTQGSERRFKLTTFPFGWDQPFEIQDQLVCNPAMPDSDFNAVGRNDDIIVLATGEKVNPQKLETMLTELDCVRSAIAFGETQFEIGVIVLSNEVLDADQHDDFKAKIWPTVLRANDVMDDHARISSPDAVIILPIGSTIPRTDKGSIARREVYKRFDSSIVAAYHKLENSITDASVTKLDPADFETGIRSLIQERLRWKLQPGDWNANSDLFELGMDSLQAAMLRRYLLAAVPENGKTMVSERIGRDFVYVHPSVSQMADALRGDFGGSETQLSDEIDSLVQAYGLNITPRLTSSVQAVILLTGATGSLGSFCLAKFVGLPNVSRVICLNRPGREGEATDALQRQKSAIKTKGLAISEKEWEKVSAFQTSTFSPLLGLGKADYAGICGSITHVLHAAWPMDFKRQLSSFKSAFQTLQNILSLLRDAHRGRPLIKPRLLFISSIATVGRYADTLGGRIVPEVPVSDLRCINDIGYAQAKLVCERIIEKATRDHGSELEASYVRFGQLSGSTESGFWNTDEHFSALVKSSQGIGAMPKLEGTFAWIPVDKAGSVLSELLLSEQPPAMVYQVENPIRQSWSDALGALASELGISRSMTFEEWLQEVETVKDATAEAIPAKKLVDFFKLDFRRMASGRVVMGTDVTRSASVTLQTLDAVRPQTMIKHIEYWRSVGYLA